MLKLEFFTGILSVDNSLNKEVPVSETGVDSMQKKIFTSTIYLYRFFNVRQGAFSCPSWNVYFVRDMMFPKLS